MMSCPCRVAPSSMSVPSGANSSDTRKRSSELASRTYSVTLEGALRGGGVAQTVGGGSAADSVGHNGEQRQACSLHTKDEV